MWEPIENNSYMFRNAELMNEKLEGLNLDALKTFSELMMQHNYVRLEVSRASKALSCTMIRQRRS